MFLHGDTYPFPVAVRYRVAADRDTAVVLDGQRRARAVADLVIQYVDLAARLFRPAVEVPGAGRVVELLVAVLTGLGMLIEILSVR